MCVHVYTHTYLHAYICIVLDTCADIYIYIYADHLAHTQRGDPVVLGLLMDCVDHEQADVRVAGIQVFVATCLCNPFLCRLARSCRHC